MSNWKHGTYTAYTNHGCRCQPCKKANSEYQRQWRKSSNYADVRVYRLAEKMAGRMMREHTPDLWDELVTDARVELGLPAKKWQRQR